METSTSSPFQATKLWNQMIRNFREGIELKKRRWKMKLYEKTFCGSDAVDWFLLYLRSNQKFGNHVTRAQSKQLLQKFLENGIFEDARGKDAKTFEDDNHLYRFTEKADEICQNKKEIATQRSVTNLIRSVSIRRDKNPNLSTDSDGAPKIVRNRNLRRVARSQSMRQALMSPRNSLIPREPIGITPLSKNFTQFKIDSSKKSPDKDSDATRGSVASSNASQSEAQVFSTNEKESNPIMQQNYPTMHQKRNTTIQQNDVSVQPGGDPMVHQKNNPTMQQINPIMQQGRYFMEHGGNDPPVHQSNPTTQQNNPKMQQGRYFETQEGNNPTIQQSDPTMQQNNPTMQQNQLDLSIEENYCSILQEAGIDNRAFIVEEMSPLVSTFSRTRSLRDPKAMRYRHKFVVSCDEEDSVFEPSLNLHKSLRRSLKRSKSIKQVTGIKFTKTDQCGSPSKKMKIYGNDTETAATKDNVLYDINNAEVGQCKAKVKALRKSGNSECSLGQSKTGVMIPKKRVDSISRAETPLERPFKDTALLGLERALEVDSLDDFINLTVMTNNEIEANINTELKSAEIPEWVLSAMKFLVNWPDKENSQNDSSLPSYEGFERDVFHAVQDHYESTLKEPIMTFNLFKLLDLASGKIDKNYTRAILIFQYLCLIIPPWNRKQMYLILRFMDKVSKNAELKLNTTLSNKEVVVNSLYSIIVRNKEMQFSDNDKVTSKRAVAFMMENHEHILKVPLELKNKLDKISNEMSVDPISLHRPTLPSVRERPVSYCVQCSKEDYSKQAEDTTRKALVDLLNMIANDDTLPQKIKRKRLKMFKKNYPEIYQRKFPEDNISTCSTTSQRTLRIRQAIRPIFFKQRHCEL